MSTSSDHESVAHVDITIDVTALHELIEVERDCQGISLCQLERIIDVPASTSSNLPKRRSDPEPRTLTALLEWLEAPAEIFRVEATQDALRRRARLLADARTRLQRRRKLDERAHAKTAPSRRYQEGARASRETPLAELG